MSFPCAAFWRALAFDTMAMGIPSGCMAALTWKLRDVMLLAQFEGFGSQGGIHRV
jgi:hypothetical protein